MIHIRGRTAPSRSPARWSEGQDHSPSFSTPPVPWGGPYMKFLREETSVSRNAQTQSPPIISAGSTSKEEPQSLPPRDHQEVGGGGPGRQGCWGRRQPERDTNTHTNLCGLLPIKSHPSINNCECLHGHAINLCETRLLRGFPY